MKKQPKVERESQVGEQLKSDKIQVLLRIEPELHAHLQELGEMCGLSRSQFIIEAMERYGDVLANAILAEDQEIEEARKRHRDQLRAKIHSSRR